MPIGVMYGLVTGISEQITPAGFAYLTMPFSGISSMMPMLFCRKRIAEDAEDLGAAPRLAAAHAALVDAHVGEAFGGVGIGAGPGDRLADAIDPGLVVVGNGRHSAARLSKKSLRQLGFSGGNRAYCHDLDGS